MDYFDKYLKYKKKYINLKKNKDFPFNQKFYITHKTWASSIPHILDDGFIRAGRDIPKKFIAQDYNIEHVFGNIIFDNFMPKQNLGFATLILDPKIIIDYNIRVYKTWANAVGPEFLIDQFIKNDSIKNINKKLDNILNFLKTDEFISKNQYDLYNHQIVFDEPIDIKKYLVGIQFCCSCSELDIKNQKKVIKALKKHKLTNIKIFYPKSKVECYDKTPYTFDEIFNSNKKIE